MLRETPMSRYNACWKFSKAVSCSDYPLTITFSYPCRGTYDFSERFPLTCKKCSDGESESPNVHGRVFLSSEEGCLLLPQIIQTKADLMQTITDLLEAYNKGQRLTFVEPTWCLSCLEFIQQNSCALPLPEGKSAEVEATDLTNQSLNLGWWCL